MTTQEKNISIAEMLGANTVVGWENMKTGFKEYTTFGEVVVQWRHNGLFTGGFEERMLTSNLKFDSDCNWQHEAIEFIESLGYPVEVCQNHCTVYTKEQPTNVIIACKDDSKKEVVFDALYEFSQYLKEKK